MGYSLSWVAVKGGHADTIYSTLSLRRTGQREELPESEIVGVELPTGWHLVLFNRKEVENGTLARLSSLGEVVYCFVEGHVTFSTASGWRDGKRQWRVIRDAEKGRSHLQVDGQASPGLDSIRDRLTAQQHASGENSEVDYLYDAPAELAHTLTCFRHDQDVPGMTGDSFCVLERTKKTGREFARALFRRNTE